MRERIFAGREYFLKSIFLCIYPYHKKELTIKHIQRYQITHTPRQKIVTELDNGGIIEFYVLSIKPEIVIARPDLGLQYHFGEDQFYGLLSVTIDE